jgi:hypothetical protein
MRRSVRVPACAGDRLRRMSSTASVLSSCAARARTADGGAGGRSCLRVWSRTALAALPCGVGLPS